MTLAHPAVRADAATAVARHVSAGRCILFLGAGVHYPLPLHRQPAYLPWAPPQGSLSVTERLCDEVLSLPMYPELDEEKRGYIVGEVLGFLRSP